MATIAERVAAGAAFLDRHDPDWWRPDVDRAIDLDRLDLEDTGSCILGQRCPLELLAEYENDPDAGYFAYGYQLMPGRTLFDCAGQHGFAGNDDEYRDLTAEWRRVITGRRAAAGQVNA